MILIAVISLGAIGAVGAVFLSLLPRNLKSMKILASLKYRKSSPERTVEVAVIRVAPVCGCLRKS